MERNTYNVLERVEVLKLHHNEETRSQDIETGARLSTSLADAADVALGGFLIDWKWKTNLARSLYKIKKK